MQKHAGNKATGLELSIHIYAPKPSQRKYGTGL